MRKRGVTRFRAIASISCKKAFPQNAGTLFLRPEMDYGITDQFGNSSAAPFAQSAFFDNLDLPPVNLRFSQSHLAQNSLASEAASFDHCFLRRGFQPLLGDAHVAACGMEIEGLRPFNTTQRRERGFDPSMHPKGGETGCGPSMHPGEETGLRPFDISRRKNGVFRRGAAPSLTRSRPSQW